MAAASFVPWDDACRPLGTGERLRHVRRLADVEFDTTEASS
jgi:hypothetical protein